MSNVTIERLSADDIRKHESDLIELLRDAVDGGAGVSFIAPLDTDIARGFWTKVAREVESDARVVLVAMQAGKVVGCAHLVLDMPPNGLHRADVQKMLVHSTARRQGIATKLLSAVDDTARELGRSLLVLDTQRYSAAETLYEKYGYIKVGIIPQYALDSTGKVMIETVIFYRVL